MVPYYEQMRRAWETGERLALDRVAEQLAGQGVDESVIFEALKALLLEERAAGADDETEDRISDVMDRLTGWCHVSNHIKTNRNPAPAAAGRTGTGQLANGVQTPQTAGSTTEAPPTGPAGR